MDCAALAEQIQNRGRVCPNGYEAVARRCCQWDHPKRHKITAWCRKPFARFRGNPYSGCAKRSLVCRRRMSVGRGGSVCAVPGAPNRISRRTTCLFFFLAFLAGGKSLMCTKPPCTTLHWPRKCVLRLTFLCHKSSAFGGGGGGVPLAGVVLRVLGRISQAIRMLRAGTCPQHTIHVVLPDVSECDPVVLEDRLDVGFVFINDTLGEVLDHLVGAMCDFRWMDIIVDWFIHSSIHSSITMREQTIPRPVCLLGSSFGLKVSLSCQR